MAWRGDMAPKEKGKTVRLGDMAPKEKGKMVRLGDMAPKEKGKTVRLGDMPPKEKGKMVRLCDMAPKQNGKVVKLVKICLKGGRKLPILGRAFYRLHINIVKQGADRCGQTQIRPCLGKLFVVRNKFLARTHDSGNILAAIIL